MRDLSLCTPVNRLYIIIIMSSPCDVEKIYVISIPLYEEIYVISLQRRFMIAAMFSVAVANVFCVLLVVYTDIYVVILTAVFIYSIFTKLLFNPCFRISLHVFRNDTGSLKQIPSSNSSSNFHFSGYSDAVRSWK